MNTMNIALLVGAIVIAASAIGFVGWLVSLRRVVPTNMVHIVQSRSATRSFGKGREAGNVYYEWPSALPIIGVTVTHFPESVFSVALHDYESYDAGRLPFRVDVRAFFRVKDSDVAAHRVSSFTELQEQLQAVLQGAVRRVLATHKLEEIMEARSSLGDAFTKEVDGQLTEWGVQTVKSIEFMDLRDSGDSRVIQQIMAKEKSRIEMESRTTVAENSRIAQTKEIEAQREVAIQKQDAEQKVGQRTAEREKAVGIANEQSRQEVLAQEKETTQRQMEVTQIEKVRAAEIAKQVMTVDAEAQRAADVTKAEADRQTTELRAQGDLAAAKNEAEGIKVIGSAKADAEKAMQMAPVAAQTALAKEIGSNEGYQGYLVTIRQVEASQAVGIAMADAVKNAELKVFATGGDVQSGVNSLTDVFGAKGGAILAQGLAALSQTEAGKALVDKATK